MPPAIGNSTLAAKAKATTARFLKRAWRMALTREPLIFLTFCLFTSLLTWPYVGQLRNAVVDPGDPYLVSWILWWDYHATFTDPLNLFHANIFYPYRYTLAFSEHCYGIALLFFPLFALGVRPLTVHVVAMYFGFALSGYATFRLARTLTGSYGIAWVAGVVFAFVPYRFHLMSHLPYFFTPWIPLLFEALVLFVRRQGRARAAWLGITVFMTGLSTITWFVLSLFPFAVCAAVLLTRHGLWRNRAVWLRGGLAVVIGCLALLPFMLPYYLAMRLYGFKREIWEIQANSAWPIHWLSVENRNKLWNGMGASIPEGHRFKLFPGLIPLLLSSAAVLLVGRTATASPEATNDRTPPRRLVILDVVIVLALVLSIMALGFDRTASFGGVFNYITSGRALAILLAASVARLCIAYPAFLRREHANLLETIRSNRRSEAFWIGSLLAVIGFCYSLGWNFILYRVLYELIPMFRSMRVPTRGAMFAYLGLALLAGLGTQQLARAISSRWPRVHLKFVYLTVCTLLLLELNAAPLNFMRGDVYPDAVTARLKQTPMRAGLVVLPAGADFNHYHILRAADHQKPLIVGTSGFNPPYEDEIERLTLNGPIPISFLDLLERIPASYLVVQNHKVIEERRAHYEAFLTRALASGRLRFINRFDGRDDLYAVVKTEPQASSEAGIPFANTLREWSAMIEEDPAHLVGHFEPWSQSVYGLYVAVFGRMPRYQEFVADVRVLGKGVIIGGDAQEPHLEQNLRRLTEALMRRDDFKALYDVMPDGQFVEKLFANAGLPLSEGQRESFTSGLAQGNETRASVLLKVASDEQLRQREANRALVLFHFFAYLRRNPEDPPDGDLNGFNHWVNEMTKYGGKARLNDAFKDSIERARMLAGAPRKG